MKHLTDIPSSEINFALYRYGHLYVAHPEGVLVLDSQANAHQVKLPFTPHTWSSYGGAVVLYDPFGGIAQFSGADIVALDEATSAEDLFSAPYATPMKNGEPIVGSHAGLRPPEINGLMYEDGPVGSVRLLAQNFTVMPHVTGAVVEEEGWLVLTKSAKRFSYINGREGSLLFGDPPTLTVPYMYEPQGLLAAGFREGYLFSPDMGISWRIRKLHGWGVLSERAILQVSPRSGVHIIEGWW